MRLFFLLVVVGFSLNLCGQSIAGIVKDSFTQEPLIGASIALNNGTGTVTGGNGEFAITPSYGKYIMTVSFIGYEDYISDTLYFFNNNISIDVMLVPSSNQLGTVVVSAGQFEQSLEEVTVSLDVIQPNLIQDKSQLKLENTLEQAPGVNITDGQANIRGGSGWSYGTGTRVQVLVDGIPLISGDARQAQWDLVPLFATRQVEVIKGASSVLYGSSAMNGVINVLTQKKPDSTSLNVNAYSRIYDAPARNELKWWESSPMENGLNFNFQQPINSKAGYILSGSYRKNQGFRYLEPEERTNLYAKGFWEPNSKLKLSLATSIMYSDVGDALIWENDSLGYIAQDSNVTGTTGWDYFIDPTLTYRSGDFIHTYKGRYLRVENNARGTGTDFSNSSDLYYSTYFLQYFKPKYTLTLGATGTYVESRSILFSGNHFSSNLAGFVQADVKPFKGLNISGGLRYERFTLDDREEARPVFRLGGSYKITNGLVARASYGEAFRFPSMAEAFTTTGLGSVNVFANPNVDPESGYTYEVGVRQLFTHKRIKGYLDIAYFNMTYSNMIEYTFAQWRPGGIQNGVLFTGLGFSPVNIQSVTISGLELASIVNFDFDPWQLRLIMGYTYALPQIGDSLAVNALNVNGDAISYASSSSNLDNGILKYRYQHLFKWDIQADYKKYGFGFSMRYNDFMQNVDEAFEQLIPGVIENRARNSNGDFIVDARVSYQINKAFSASLLAENLFNREVMVRPAYLAAPRSFILRLNYSF